MGSTAVVCDATIGQALPALSEGESHSNLRVGIKSD